MTLASDYNARMKDLTALEFSIDGLIRYAALPAARRKPEEVAQALQWAARVILAQSKLTGRMRVALQPFAMAAPSWKGSDDTVIVDGKGYQLNLGQFRAANQAWHSRA